MTQPRYFISPTEKTKVTCYHCGNECTSLLHTIEDKVFCCQGCQTVYEILSQNNLCDYYTLNEKAGINLKKVAPKEKFAYLDLPAISEKIIDFSDGKTTNVTFYVPAIHCSSCLWLLEKLYKLQPSILRSQVDFLKKQLYLSFDPAQITLREVVELLASIGYEPLITLEKTEKDDKTEHTNRLHKRLIGQIAVAGLCFANIMILSFAEYFGFDSLSERQFRGLFQGINLLLTLPVFFYSAQDYFISSWQGLRKGYLNTDFALSLGMAVLFVRSIYELATQTGIGYLDTLSGLVFFLLVGKWFQESTYQYLRYDRDFKSYFPIAVTVKTDKGEQLISVRELKVGDEIMVRNQELIPVDGLLIEGEANIDYSFVSGESLPIRKTVGSVIYAGGRQMGSNITLSVVKTMNQSYLISLWNNSVFSKEKTNKHTIQALFNKYFTVILLGIALCAGVYWVVQTNDYFKALNAFTSVLIIACPCALSLSSQFALGTAVRILGKYGFFLKNTDAVEEFAQANTIVFDKTGTITENNIAEISFVKSNDTADTFNLVELSMIKSVVNTSTHPLSRLLYNFLKQHTHELYKVTHLQEFSGRGLIAQIGIHHIVVGSEEFVREHAQAVGGSREKITPHTAVFIAIDGEIRGYFSFKNIYREGVCSLVRNLKKRYDVRLLSGDNEGEAQSLSEVFEGSAKMNFHQSPADKLAFVAQLQKEGKKVLMLGDGLNDAGALRQSNAGIAVTEDIGSFTPASDAILEASQLKNLDKYLLFSQKSVRVIKASFVMATLYNIVGLSFAVQGALSPLISAILMPASSVSVILFTTLWVASLEKSVIKKNVSPLN
jgi:Cu+-exporting ATPase